MNLRSTLAAAACALLALPALANHCPKDMAAIDKALADNPKLSAEQLDKVKSLRAQGEELHKAGKHAESVEVLGKVLEILNAKK